MNDFLRLKITSDPEHPEHGVSVKTPDGALTLPFTGLTYRVSNEDADYGGLGRVSLDVLAIRTWIELDSRWQREDMEDQLVQVRNSIDYMRGIETQLLDFIASVSTEEAK